MDIILVGDFNTRSTNVSQARALEKIGNCVRFDFREMLRRKEDPYKRMVELCCKITPSLVIFCKCNELDSRIVYNAKDNGAKTALWYPDSMNNNFGKALIQKIKVCDHSFFALRTPLECAKEISQNCHFLAEGFDPEIDTPVDYLNMKQAYDVSFIGNLDNHRLEMIKYLENNGIKVHIFVNSYGKRHAVAVAQSKINLNFTRNKDGTSDRIYKIMAAGGFILTEFFNGIAEDFSLAEMGIFAWNDKEDLLWNVNYYLKEEKERQKKAELGFFNVQRFSRINWAKNIVEISMDERN